MLEARWSEEEIRLVERLPTELFGFLLGDPTRPKFELMDADRWYVAHGYMLEGFALGDPAWESLAFRLWLTRVLAYTTNQAGKGFDAAMAYLEGTIRALRDDGRRVLLIPEPASTSRTPTRTTTNAIKAPIAAIIVTDLHPTRGEHLGGDEVANDPAQAAGDDEKRERSSPGTRPQLGGQRDGRDDPELDGDTDDDQDCHRRE